MTMVRQAAKTAVVVAASAVAVPYFIAILTNLMYGWPQCKNKYRRYGTHRRRVVNLVDQERVPKYHYSSPSLIRPPYLP